MGCTVQCVMTRELTIFTLSVEDVPTHALSLNRSDIDDARLSLPGHHFPNLGL